MNKALGELLSLCFLHETATPPLKLMCTILLWVTIQNPRNRMTTNQEKDQCMCVCVSWVFRGRSAPYSLATPSAFLNQRSVLFQPTPMLNSKTLMPSCPWLCSKDLQIDSMKTKVCLEDSGPASPNNFETDNPNFVVEVEATQKQVLSRNAHPSLR